MNDLVLKRKLFCKLRKYYNDKDFVIGVMSNLTHDDDIKTMIEYIDNGEDVSIENIILLSLHCNGYRTKHQNLFETD